MALQVEARDEGLVAADDHHHQQVGDHHHVDQAEHDQHDVLLAQGHRLVDQMPQFLGEQEHVHGLGQDQAEVQRELQPARAPSRAGGIRVEATFPADLSGASDSL